MQKLYGAKKQKGFWFLHKVSKRLSSQYDAIYAENLGEKRNLNNADKKHFLPGTGHFGPKSEMCWIYNGPGSSHIYVRVVHYV